VRGFPAPPALFGDLTGLGRLFPQSRWGAYRRPPLNDDQPVLVDQPMTSCLLLRRAALAAVGNFDEQFPLFFNDVDLCYRLRAAGWEIWYDPRIRVLHHGGASTRQVRPAAIWQSHRGLLRFYRKHYRARIGPIGYAAASTAIMAAGVARWIGAQMLRTIRG
jgi:GT2 family glycosyltransferase